MFYIGFTTRAVIFSWCANNVFTVVDPNRGFRKLVIYFVLGKDPICMGVGDSCFVQVKIYVFIWTFLS